MGWVLFGDRKNDEKRRKRRRILYSGSASHHYIRGFATFQRLERIWGIEEKEKNLIRTNLTRL